MIPAALGISSHARNLDRQSLEDNRTDDYTGAEVHPLLVHDLQSFLTRMPE